ncbi:MAG TPA: CDP-diacylglycerol diphosphatase, partial [Amaricoccus sp.]
MRRLLALALLAACAPAPEPDTRSFALYRAMQTCLADPATAGCTRVDRARGFVVLADDDPAKPRAWLLVPDVEVTGIEDSRALVPPVVAFWRHGWTVGRDLLPGERLALAINSKGGRTQDLLHIHISCLAPEIA